MVMSPRVSFILPCYNHGHFLAECVNSILKQSFGDFEVLIMDDCSPDDTPAIARSFGDPRVIHVRNEQNLGHLANYNKGIGLAKGTYIWLINVDDFLQSPQVLEKFVAVMEKVPTAAYVFCRAFSVRGGVEVAPHAIHGTTDRVYSSDEFLEHIVVRNTISTPAVMVRRSSYDRVGRFEPDLPYSGDWFQWCRHAFHGEVAYLAEPMVCYRVHDTGMSQWYRQNPHKLIRDEVEVRWRVRAMAEKLGRTSIVNAATDAIAWDYGVRVSLKLTEDWPLGMTMEAFNGSLRAHTGDPAVIAQATVTVLRAVADAHYRSGDMVQARVFYDRAVAAAPSHVATRAKRALLATGSVGRRLRTAAARLREGAAAS
jgi:glycosyltransferase involved in cell wall biosynthesis